MAGGIIGQNTREALQSYTRVKFLELSDAALAGYNFRIEEPLTLPNLSEDEPPLDQDLTWIGEYKSAQYLKCVFGHIHKWGFVFRDDDGRHYLIGNECGARLLGLENWRDFDKQQKDLTDRSQYLRQLYAVRAAFAVHLDWIKSLATVPALQSLATLRERFAQYTDMVQAVRRVSMRDNGQLTVIRKVRDFDEEERREERETAAIAEFAKLNAEDRAARERSSRVPKISKNEIWRDERVSGGTLNGRMLFSSRPTVTARAIEDLTRQIEAFLAVERMPTQKKDIKSMSINTREMVKKLLKFRDDIEEAISFFDPDNIERFARWANQNRFDWQNFRTSRGRLQIEHVDGGEVDEFVRPMQLRSIDSPVLEELRLASVAFARYFD